jgi:biotin operon repressor
MSKSDQVLRELVTAGSAGVTQEDLMKKIGLTESAVYTHISRLNQDGNKITIGNGRYFCLKTAATEILEQPEGEPEKTTEEPVTPSKDTKLKPLYEQVVDVIKEAGEKGVTPVETASKMNSSVNKIFGYLHAAREKGYMVDFNHGKYIYKKDHAPSSKIKRW